MNIKKLNFYWWLIIAQLGLMGSRAVAQITPDTTLPNNSAVMRNGKIITIDEGTVNGSNLFHSFSEFNVDTGETAFFNNALSIDNILTRVTGGQLSSIDGLIQANGTANLFLLNPNGIQFGPNARLNIGGSFLASTAESLIFEDGNIYSATNPAESPLLTVNVPIGLQFGSNPERIVVQGPGHSFTTLEPQPFDPEIVGFENRTIGLAVKPGQTLALVGGELVLKGGNLTAEAGRIELGSVAGEGIVNLFSTNPGWRLVYEEVSDFQDISLSQRAAVDTSSSGSGNIQIQGKTLKVTEGSAIVAITLGSENGGGITINTSESVEVIGEDLATGFNSEVRSDVGRDAIGNGGDLKVETKRLLIKDGGVLGTSSYGDGDAGDIIVNTSESVELIGEAIDGFPPSRMLTWSEPLTSGNTGKFTLQTQRLLLDQGQLGAATTSSGDAGDVFISASESIEITGITSNRRYRAGFFASTLFGGSGDAGTMRIFTPSLTVRNEGNVNVSSFQSTGFGVPSTGNAGNLELQADSIFLDNEGIITASVAAGANGNIFIDSENILLRRDSIIVTNALGKATGGNITIDTNTIVAADNGDISANAEQSFGGRVIINSQGIFGTQFREQSTPESDITASSELGAEFSGIVTINNPDADPTSGLVELPAQTTDPSDQVTVGCEAASGNSFAITGRGGLPEDPTATIRGQTVLFDLRDFTESEVNDENLPPVKKQARQELPKAIVQVKGWIVNQDGEIELVAALPQESSFLQQHPNCLQTPDS